MSDLHGDAERSREALWAAKEDAKALEAMRRKIKAEAEMATNVAVLVNTPQN